MRKLGIIIIMLVVLTGFLVAGNVDPDAYLAYDIKRANPDLTSQQVEKILELPRLQSDHLRYTESTVFPMYGKYLAVRRDRGVAAIVTISRAGCYTSHVLFFNDQEAEK